MTDVGNVTNLFDVVSVVFEYAAQRISHKKSTEVTDVSVTVDRRSARVHRDLAGLERYKFLKSTRQSIRKEDRGSSLHLPTPTVSSGHSTSHLYGPRLVVKARKPRYS